MEGLRFEDASGRQFTRYRKRALPERFRGGCVSAVLRYLTSTVHEPRDINTAGSHLIRHGKGLTDELFRCGQISPFKSHRTQSIEGRCDLQADWSNPFFYRK